MKRRAADDPVAECEDRALDAAIDAVLRDVFALWRQDRPLASLNRSDLRKVCVAAICGFIVEKSRCDEALRAGSLLSAAGIAEPI